MTRLVAEALPRPQRLRLLVGLWRRGFTDDQIADALTYTTYTAARIRVELGLPANAPRKEGTPHEPRGAHVGPTTTRRVHRDEGRAALAR